MQVESIEREKLVEMEKEEEEVKTVKIDKKKQDKMFKKAFNQTWNSMEMNVTHQWLGVIFYLILFTYFVIIEPAIS